MLDMIWAGIMVLSAVVAVCTGRADVLTRAVFDGASSAVDVVISLCGGICFFSGLMNIAQKSGFTSVITALLRPLLGLIFPRLDMRSPAAQAISMNITANMLGLGNAATPFGLRAMRELEKMHRESGGEHGRASDYMVTFVVINTAAVQLIPTTVAMLRATAGSPAPLEIMPCVWAASLSALTVGVGAANILNRAQGRILHKRRVKHHAFSG